ncbi:MAG: acetolactate synthase small subunit [Candidatus Omnitrophica bacterium]|nr:acetolactate synthase small subunit [Candidatus Omnitrophota bacterium]
MKKGKVDKFTLTVIVENKFGVLARIAGLFSARGFNIHSLAVSETEDPTISCMTIVVIADEKILEQIKKQLNKLIDVVEVIDLTNRQYEERELVLINIKVTSKTKDDIMRVIHTMGAEILDVGKNTITIEETGDTKKINSIIELLRPFGIKEVVRTGKIAIQTEGEKREN